jgi:hypothetical protein
LLLYSLTELYSLSRSDLRAHTGSLTRSVCDHIFTKVLHLLRLLGTSNRHPPSARCPDLEAEAQGKGCFCNLQARRNRSRSKRPGRILTIETALPGNGQVSSSLYLTHFILLVSLSAGTVDGKNTKIIGKEASNGKCTTENGADFRVGAPVLTCSC